MNFGSLKIKKNLENLAFARPYSECLSCTYVVRKEFILSYLPKKVSAWQFGVDPDHLAQLVIDGVKSATCSGLIFYEIENEPLPSVEDYSIILNSKDEPLAIIKTVEVKIMPMNEVPEEFAIAEGEGDRTYQYWKEAH